MATNKLKIIYMEEDGKPLSYQYLEKSEALRIKKLLKIIPSLKTWMPIQRIAKHIRGKRISTTQAVFKLAGAKKIMLDDKTIAEAPIILIRKESYNHRNNPQRKKQNS